MCHSSHLDQQWGRWPTAQLEICMDKSYLLPNSVSDPHWDPHWFQCGLLFTYPKDVQATGEAFSTQKRTSSTENLKFLPLSLPSFPLRIRIQPTKIKADPDPKRYFQITQTGSSTFTRFFTNRSCINDTYLMVLSASGIEPYPSCSSFKLKFLVVCRWV